MKSPTIGDTPGSRSGSMPMIAAPTSRLEKRITPCVLRLAREAAGNPALEPGGRGGRVDDAAAIVARPEPGNRHCREDILGRLTAGCALLVGDVDMRHRVDELLDEIVLPTLHQRRHGNGESDADRNADDGNQRLATAAGNVREGDVEDERASPSLLGAR